MKRWWVDRDEALSVLGSVDGSDPGQGLATAFLGLHALQRSALAPLASSTLVDGSTVLAHMRTVDLSPVAKAAAAATRPELGDAADEYGHLFAQDAQDRSIAAAEAVLGRWTNQGMPWPTAVQRLTSITGVPLRDLGRTVERLKAPASDLVVADYGDRALLGYAGRVSQTARGSIAKNLKGAELFRFNQNHPRDEDGQFTEKPQQPGRPGKEKRSRLKRARQRIRRQRTAQAQRQQQTVDQRASGRDFADVVLALTQRDAATAERREVARDTRREIDRGKRKVDRAALRPVRNKTSSAVAVNELMPQVPKSYGYRLENVTYMVVDQSVTDAILLSDTAEFNVQGLTNLLGTGEREAYGIGEIDEFLALGQRGLEARGIQNPVVVAFNTTAVDDVNTSRNGLTYSLANDAVYSVGVDVPRGRENRYSAYDFNDTFTVGGGGGSPAARNEPAKPVPVLNVWLQNEGDFAALNPDLPFDQSSRARALRGPNFEKALSGRELFEFNQRHPRDEEGQFTTKPGSPSVDRKARLKRARRRIANQRAVQQRRETAEREAVALQGSDFADRVMELSSDRKAARAPRVIDRSVQMQRGKLKRRIDRSVQMGSRDARKYDLANATALVLDDQMFTDVTGLDMDLSALPEDMNGPYDFNLDEMQSLLAESQMTGQDALTSLAGSVAQMMQQRPTKPLPAQDEYVGYSSYDAASQAAMEYIAETQMDDGTTMHWAPAAEAILDPTTGVTSFYPRRVGFDYRQTKNLIFGSDRAIQSIRSGDADWRRLTQIPADTLKELLALNDSQGRFQDLQLRDGDPNPFVRAFWYRDGDD